MPGEAEGQICRPWCCLNNEKGRERIFERSSFLNEERLSEDDRRRHPLYCYVIRSTDHAKSYSPYSRHVLRLFSTRSSSSLPLEPLASNGVYAVRCHCLWISHRAGIVDSSSSTEAESKPIDAIINFKYG